MHLKYLWWWARARERGGVDLPANFELLKALKDAREPTEAERERHRRHQYLTDMTLPRPHNNPALVREVWSSAAVTDHGEALSVRPVALA